MDLYSVWVHYAKLEKEKKKKLRQNKMVIGRGYIQVDMWVNYQKINKSKNAKALKVRVVFFSGR